MSKARPKLPNGLPSWLTAPDIALPRLQFDFTPRFGWRCQIMLGHPDESRWATCIIPATPSPAQPDDHESLVVPLLVDWRLDPEGCCRRWFKCEPPTAAGAGPAVPVDPSSLGF